MDLAWAAFRGSTWDGHSFHLLTTYVVHHGSYLSHFTICLISFFLPPSSAPLSPEGVSKCCYSSNNISPKDIHFLSFGV